MSEKLEKLMIERFEQFDKRLDRVEEMIVQLIGIVKSTNQQFVEFKQEMTEFKQDMSDFRRETGVRFDSLELELSRNSKTLGLHKHKIADLEEEIFIMNSVKKSG